MSEFEVNTGITDGRLFWAQKPWGVVVQTKDGSEWLAFGCLQVHCLVPWARAPAFFHHTTVNMVQVEPVIAGQMAQDEAKAHIKNSGQLQWVINAHKRKERFVMVDRAFFDSIGANAETAEFL